MRGYEIIEKAKNLQELMIWQKELIIDGVRNGFPLENLMGMVKELDKTIEEFQELNMLTNFIPDSKVTPTINYTATTTWKNYTSNPTATYNANISWSNTNDTNVLFIDTDDKKGK